MSGTTIPVSDQTTSLGPNPDIERLYDNVQAIVPGVQLPLLQIEAWNVIEDFYIRSTVRRREVFWEMASGVPEVGFNPYDAEWLVAWVLGVTGLIAFRIDPPATLYDLRPTASLRKGTALLALKPVAFTVSPGGSELWSTWFETVLNGVLYRLYRTPAKPYSSPQLAQFHGHSYRAGCAQARAAADMSFTDGGGRWRVPYFANGRRKN